MSLKSFASFSFFLVASPADLQPSDLASLTKLCKCASHRLCPCRRRPGVCEHRCPRTAKLCRTLVSEWVTCIWGTDAESGMCLSGMYWSGSQNQNWWWREGGRAGQWEGVNCGEVAALKGASLRGYVQLARFFKVDLDQGSRRSLKSASHCLGDAPEKEVLPSAKWLSFPSFAICQTGKYPAGEWQFLGRTYLRSISSWHSQCFLGSGRKWTWAVTAMTPHDDCRGAPAPGLR